MTDTGRIVDAYYERWGRGDFEGLRAILDDDLRFRGAIDRADGADAFIDLIRRNAPAFGEVRFSEVRRVVDGPRAVSLYTFEAGFASVPMAEAFEVAGERIVRIDLYFDPTAFRPPASAPTPG
jgi:ketosteroid isomerase-like protein